MNGAVINEFATNGFVVIKNAVQDAALQPLIEKIQDVVDKKINVLHQQGLITNKYESESFSRRWSEVNKEYQANEQMWVRQIFSKAIYDLGVDTKIVDAVEALIGQEIRFNGDYHVRPKLPHQDLTVVPWHQDAYYYGGKESANPLFPIVSIWIPLVDVNEDNGCLQFVPGSHKWGMKPEWNEKIPNLNDGMNNVKRSPHVLDEQGVSLPMKKGDMVVFDKLTFHRSLPNVTNDIRWNVDLRYGRADQSFAWSGLGDEIDVKYPSFVVKSLLHPASVMTWEQYNEKFLKTCNRYDENGSRIS
jgi:phytanoyl-CoA hydroxylase